MPEKPLISVIIPVFNHAPEALLCLVSLKGQTHHPLEVVMVDDGSSDGLEKMVNDVPWPFPFRFIRFGENRGAPAARNEGFRNAKGEYVIFLDADIELIPTALEKMLNTLLDHKESAFAYGDFYFGWKLFKGKVFDVEALKRGNYIHTSSLIRREAFFGFDESLKKFQDWDLWLTLAERGGQGIWIPEALMRIKPRAEGISRWMPKIVHRLPWKLIGWMPREVARYKKAEAIIKQKHRL